MTPRYLLFINRFQLLTIILFYSIFYLLGLSFNKVSSSPFLHHVALQVAFTHTTTLPMRSCSFGFFYAIIGRDWETAYETIYSRSHFKGYLHRGTAALEVHFFVYKFLPFIEVQKLPHRGTDFWQV